MKNENGTATSEASCADNLRAAEAVICCCTEA